MCHLKVGLYIIYNFKIDLIKTDFIHTGLGLDLFYKDEYIKHMYIFIYLFGSVFFQFIVCYYQIQIRNNKKKLSFGC